MIKKVHIFLYSESGSVYIMTIIVVVLAIIEVLFGGFLGFLYVMGSV